jgi:hypothetical protein
VDSLPVEKVLNHLNHTEHAIFHKIEQFRIVYFEFLLQEGIDHGMHHIFSDITGVR